MELKKNNIIGLTEKVIIIGKRGNSKTIVARIDTGAVISSLDVNLAKELDLGPILKTKKVKSANGVTERPIVKCWFSIKNNKYLTPVTLADRKNLKYKALIGQNLLKKTKLYINPRIKSK
jgi:hypothetical protein